MPQLYEQVFECGLARYSCPVMWDIAPPAVWTPIAPLLRALRDSCWGYDNPSPADVIARRIEPFWGSIWKSDLRYAIIVAPYGRVADGHHRIAKAHLLGKPRMRVRQFERWEDMDPAAV